MLNKPAGLTVHPAPGNKDGTLVNGLRHHCPDLPGIGGEMRPGIVHRLDKDTSGCIVVAKSQEALVRLKLDTGRTHQIRGERLEFEAPPPPVFAQWPSRLACCWA